MLYLYSIPNDPLKTERKKSELRRFKEAKRFLTASETYTDKREKHCEAACTPSIFRLYL